MKRTPLSVAAAMMMLLVPATRLAGQAERAGRAIVGGALDRLATRRSAFVPRPFRTRRRVR
jgi:hypothetical protein